MIDTVKKEEKVSKFETRLEELDKKAVLPQREGVLRTALTDLVNKQKAAEVRATEDKVAIDAAQLVVEKAEADIKE